MIFVYGYLLIALCIFCYLIGNAYYRCQRDGYRDWRIKLGMDNHVLVNVGIILVVTLGWAIVLGWLLIENIFCRSSVVENEDEKSFTVKSEDIITYLTQEAIEHDAIIYDPLNAVPSVAFGHLNTAWLDFIAQCQPDDQIASFAATHTYWGSKNRYIGFVCVSAGVPTHYFLTEIR